MALILLLSVPMPGWHAVRTPSGRPAVARAGVLRSVAAAPTSSMERFEVPATGYDAWAADLDYTQFRKQVHTLGQSLAGGQGEADLKHLRKMVLWSNICGAVGIATIYVDGSPCGPAAVHHWAQHVDVHAVDDDRSPHLPRWIQHRR